MIWKRVWQAEIVRRPYRDFVRMKLTRTLAFSEIEVMMYFHSSIVQCYIAGDHARSMRSSLTRNMESISVHSINSGPLGASRAYIIADLRKM
jgi:hypothetical protein